MLDIPVKSSKSNEELEFEAITKKIPPLGAPVHLVFKPKLKKQGATKVAARSREPEQEDELRIRRRMSAKNADRQGEVAHESTYWRRWVVEFVCGG